MHLLLYLFFQIYNLSSKTQSCLKAFSVVSLSWRSPFFSFCLSFSSCDQGHHPSFSSSSWDQNLRVFLYRKKQVTAKLMHVHMRRDYQHVKMYQVSMSPGGRGSCGRWCRCLCLLFFFGGCMCISLYCSGSYSTHKQYKHEALRWYLKCFRQYAV